MVITTQEGGDPQALVSLLKPKRSVADVLRSQRPTRGTEAQGETAISGAIGGFGPETARALQGRGKR